MDVTTIEVIITMAKTAAERLDVVAESKLDTKSRAEAREAQHALANLRQHLSILHEQLRRLQAGSPNLHRFVQAKEDSSVNAIHDNPVRQAPGDG